MSYAIHAYAVSLGTLKKSVGSQKGRLVKKLHREFGSDFEEIDELDEDAVPVQQAISDLVMGEAQDADSGFKYGYALEFLCRRFGEWLPNRHWSAMRWEWIEEVDAFLAEAGVGEAALRVGHHLVGRGSPIPIPAIDDFPAIGYLSHAEIVAVAPAVKALVDADPDSDDTHDAVAEMYGWFDHCLRGSVDLVCFYS